MLMSVQGYSGLLSSVHGTKAPWSCVLMAGHLCHTLVMSAYEPSWTAMSSHEHYWAALSSHEHSWAWHFGTLSTHKHSWAWYHGAMNTYEKSWHHFTILMSVPECSWVLMNGHEHSWVLRHFYKCSSTWLNNYWKVLNEHPAVFWQYFGPGFTK